MKPLDAADNLENPAFDDAPASPSKSQKKRDMHALQALGEELATLPPARLARIEMPEALRAALQEAQRLTKHEARRRQMQYIGRLMRDADPAPIRAALDAIRGVSAAETGRQHRLERLRLRLLEDEAALTEIGAAHPGADLTRLRQLRRNALKERDAGQPPRAFRELFRLLRELDDEPESPA
ncbi:MAG: DUF615 domain-containing protein [Zoogloeaceae bacterium]|jgi:ribosome-associated protein|nr:DUF615 domain-containing protein [Zoogloeaceae bacterium]